MSGVLGAMVAIGCDPFIVDVAAPGSSVFGYALAAYGALTPTTLRGTTVSNVATLPTVDFRIFFDANVSQSYFRSVLVQDGTGAWRQYTSAAATFSHPSGSTSQWDWTGGTAVWTSNHGNRSLVFYY